jgi:hypothetical protein
MELEAIQAFLVVSKLVIFFFVDFFPAFKVNKCVKGMLLQCSADVLTTATFMVSFNMKSSQLINFFRSHFASCPNLQGLYGPGCVAFPAVSSASDQFTSSLLVSGRFTSAVYGGKSSDGACNADVLFTVGFTQHWNTTLSQDPKRKRQLRCNYLD